jgi:predicted aspartyl protease
MCKHKVDISIEEIDKKNYHLFIEIKVQKVPLRLLIDTGASKTVFDRQQVLKVVNENKIKAIETKSVGLGVSEVETKVVKLKELKFGTMNVKKIEAAVLDLSHVNHSYDQLELPQIDGVLGSDFLMKYKAVVNYKKSMIVFED